MVLACEKGLAPDSNEERRDREGLGGIRAGREKARNGAYGEPGRLIMLPQQERERVGAEMDTKHCAVALSIASADINNMTRD